MMIVEAKHEQLTNDVQRMNDDEWKTVTIQMMIIIITKAFQLRFNIIL